MVIAEPEMQKIEKTWPNPEKWAIIWLPNDGGHRKRMLVSWFQLLPAFGMARMAQISLELASKMLINLRKWL